MACDLDVVWRRRGAPVSVRAIDLSPKGMLLLTPEPVMVQFAMDLVITLPEGVIEVLGQVRFAGQTARGPGVGVSLMSMTAEENARWWSYYRAAVTASRRRPPTAPPRRPAPQVGISWAL